MRISALACLITIRKRLTERDTSKYIVRKSCRKTRTGTNYPTSNFWGLRPKVINGQNREGYEHSSCSALAGFSSVLLYFYPYEGFLSNVTGLSTLFLPPRPLKAVGQRLFSSLQSCQFSKTTFICSNLRSRSFCPLQSSWFNLSYGSTCAVYWR